MHCRSALSLTCLLAITACGTDTDTSALEDRIAALEDADEETADVVALQLAVDDAISRVEVLEGRLSVLGDLGETVTLRTELTGLSIELDALERTVEGQQVAVDTLDADVDALAPAVASNSSELTTLSMVSQAATDDLSALQSSLALVDADVQAVHDDVDALAGSTMSVWTDARLLRVPSEYPTVADALDALASVRLMSDVTIELAVGTHSLGGLLDIDHPDGGHILIRGQASGTVTVHGQLRVPHGRTVGQISALHLQGSGSNSAITLLPGATARLSDVQISGWATGVSAEGATLGLSSVVLHDNATAISLRSTYLDASNVDMYDNGSAGLLADTGSVVRASGMSSSDAFRGYKVLSGSILAGDDLSAMDSPTGFELDSGSVLATTSTTSEGHDNWGYYVGAGSVMTAQSLVANDNGSDGVFATAGAVVDLRYTNNIISNSGRYGAAAFRGAMVDVGGTTPTNSGRLALNATLGGFVQAAYSDVEPTTADPSTTDAQDVTHVLLQP